jgi:hypothetical protein
MTRIYLDTSAYNRPFDDQTQSKIFLESQAVAIILQMVETGMIELASSSVLECENNRNSYPIKQQAMSRSLQMAPLKQEVRKRGAKDGAIVSNGYPLGSKLRGRGMLEQEKPPIFDMIQRGGQVVIRMLENVQQQT